MIETESYFEEYVVNYTNAATIVNEDFQGTEDLDGLFSGFDPETGTYDRSSWMYEGGEVAAAAGQREHSTQAFSDRTGAGMLTGDVERDDTLEHPRCVFQLLQAALLALHAGDGRARVRRPAGGVPRGGRGADRELRPRAHHACSLTRSAGPSTPRACR